MFTLSEIFTPIFTGFFSLKSLLSILADAVIWMVSILHQISSSLRPFSRLLLIVSKVPTSVDIIVTFIFFIFIFILWQDLRIWLLIRLLSFFTLWSVVTPKFTILGLIFLNRFCFVCLPLLMNIGNFS